MLEKQVERRLKIEVEKLGGLCWKFVSPGNDGVPDRLVLMPNAKAYFAETKRPGKTPRPLQLFIHKILRLLGFKVFVIDDYESVKAFINYIKKDLN